MNVQGEQVEEQVIEVQEEQTELKQLDDRAMKKSSKLFRE